MHNHELPACIINMQRLINGIQTLVLQFNTAPAHLMGTNDRFIVRRINANRSF